MTVGEHDPTPEEVGATYDQFGDLYSLTIGDVGIHLGMWTPPGERAPASTLADLANRAQERQTEHHLRTLALQPGDHLLDIGCGTGGPAVQAARGSGARVTGITVSREQIKTATGLAEAKGVADRVSFAYGNAMSLDFPDASFDAALSIEVFAHFSDRQRGFHEAARVLKPGGVFLMSDFTMIGTPSPEELDAYVRTWCCPAPTTLPDLIGMAQAAGFDLLRAESMTQNCSFTGQVMGLLYQERRDVIATRYGDDAVAHMDLTVPLVRSFISDHLGSYLLFLSKPPTSVRGG